MTQDSAKSGAHNCGESKLSFLEHFVPREQGSVYAHDYKGAGPAFVLMHGFPDNLHIRWRYPKRSLTDSTSLTRSDPQPLF